jgi:hypothetical protein
MRIKITFASNPPEALDNIFSWLSAYMDSVVSDWNYSTKTLQTATVLHMDKHFFCYYSLNNVVNSYLHAICIALGIT